MAPLSYEESIRILLNGTCGANVLVIKRATGLSEESIRRFLGRGRYKTVTRDDTLEKLGWFVWRKNNANVLIGPEDLHHDQDRDKDS